MSSKNRATEIVRRRYNRIAPFYDLMEGMMERASFHRWRKELWRRVEGERILEIGVGTGKNLPYYPGGAEITAIDLSEKMLARAHRKAHDLGLKVNLQVMDAQKLQFADDSFDTVVASFVFCSVPDPVLGLQEVRRVLKPGGKVVLLEHVLSDNRFLAWLMDLANPLAERMGGENINRRTVENVRKSGLTVEKVASTARGILKLVEARKL
ncbi:MAG: methyltransferase domain-containing protein [Chloroflexi bacterium]|nr:methyltransferase domain-containing protein [Chloroflexota bacterium]